MPSDAAVLADMRRRIQHAKDEGVNYVRMPLDNAEDIVRTLAERKMSSLAARVELDVRIEELLCSYPMFVRHNHLWETLSVMRSEPFPYTMGQVTAAVTRLVKEKKLLRGRVPTEPDTLEVRLRNINQTSGRVRGPLRSPASIHPSGDVRQQMKRYEEAVNAHGKEYNQLLDAVTRDDKTVELRAIRSRLISVTQEELEVIISKAALY